MNFYVHLSFALSSANEMWWMIFTVKNFYCPHLWNFDEPTVTETFSTGCKKQGFFVADNVYLILWLFVVFFVSYSLLIFAFWRKRRTNRCSLMLFLFDVLFAFVLEKKVFMIFLCMWNILSWNEDIQLITAKIWGKNVNESMTHSAANFFNRGRFFD